MGTPEYTVSEAIDLFADMGLDGIEIVVQDGYRSGIPVDCPGTVLRDIKEHAQRRNLKIICLTPYFSRFNDPDAQVRSAELKETCKVIGYAAFLGAQYIRIYAGNFSQDDTDESGEKRAHLVESMRILGEEAQKVGVKLVLENHFHTMTVSARESISISEEIGHPAVGILYDQANLTFTGKEDWEQALKLQMRKVFYTHVKDLKFKQGNIAFTSSDVSHPKEEERNVVTKIVGEGEIPWPKILKAMKEEYSYDGWLSLEYERRWHPDDIPDASEGMKKSAEYVRAVLKTISG